MRKVLKRYLHYRYNLFLLTNTNRRILPKVFLSTFLTILCILCLFVIMKSFPLVWLVEIFPSNRKLFPFSEIKNH
jgi:hypothetical protein